MHTTTHLGTVRSNRHLNSAHFSEGQGDRRHVVDCNGEANAIETRQKYDVDDSDSNDGMWVDEGRLDDELQFRFYEVIEDAEMYWPHSP
ncbi:hypothetical protein Lal_00004311 [Lupinus albus]|nr:hypothetical protein Lal_00004311 [Lupinus albus]